MEFAVDQMPMSEVFDSEFEMKADLVPF